LSREIFPERDWSGLFESGIFDGGQRTVPNGCDVVEVEIDAGSRGTSRHTHAWLSI
jgi:hypothetical protein